MRVFASFEAVSLARPQVVTIGVFDGLHQGHRYLIERAASMAGGMGAGVTLVTFWPMPVVVLRPGITAHCLMLPDEKVQTLDEMGIIDSVIVQPFTPEFSRLSPEEFMQALQSSVPVVGMVEGDDFSLGHNRAGTIAWLQEYGRQHGIPIEQVARRATDGSPISSSRIRRLIAEGDVANAAALLGRRYQVRGEVVHGDHRGRLLGFPTANLLPDPHKLLPANGIYAVRAWNAATPEVVWDGAASIGTRPTFNGTDRRFEVFLLDVSLDLYGAHLCVEMVVRLREERAFASSDELIAQMAEDVRLARHLLRQERTGAIE
jgi:riboflavin kinase / FMN adenylyltransferase